MATARVVLKKAKSYTVGKRRWVQDVPQVIKGEDEIKLYEANGHFHVSRLKSATKSKSAAPASGKKFVKRKPEKEPDEF